MNHATLRRAGVARCQKLLTLAPNRPLVAEELMADQKNLMVASIVESMLKARGVTTVTCVYDWCGASSARARARARARCPFSRERARARSLPF